MYQHPGRTVSYGAAFLLVALTVLLLLAAAPFLSGCGGGVGYASVAKASKPDPDGTFRPHYIPQEGAARSRWVTPVVTFRVRDDRTGAVDRAARMAAQSWNAGFVQALSGAPIVLTPAARGEPEQITVHSTGWRKVKDGELSGNTDHLYGPDSLTITHADIYFDPIMPVLNLTGLDNVLAHEFGHALGIRFESPNRGDVMNPSARNFRQISERDVNTLLNVYGGDPGTVVTL